MPNGFCLTVDALRGQPAIWRKALAEALQQLRAPWAVRSSSTVEDSRSAAYPGLFVTTLDLSEVRSVVEAVDQVQASTEADTVRAYAAHHGLDLATIRMAAVVQSLVIAETAGVAFTRDPLTNEREVAIEANYGFGETVVDGSVIPDAYWVDEGGAIVRRRIGSKREKVVATTSSARLRRLPTSELERRSCVLGDDDVVRIAEIARQLENELDYPVDMEWAISRSELFVLQARPITSISSGAL